MLDARSDTLLGMLQTHEGDVLQGVNGRQMKAADNLKPEKFARVLQEAARTGKIELVVERGYREMRWSCDNLEGPAQSR